MASQRPIVSDGDVDSAVVAEFERSRRDLLRRGIAIGGTVVAASSIPALLRVRNAFAAADGDGQILEAAIRLEQTAVFAYDTAIKSGLLDTKTRGIARLFRGQEKEHEDALTAAVVGFGGRAPATPITTRDVMGLDGLKSQRDVLRFAVELETMAVAAYYDAHRKLRDARLLQTGASIMANEGQHLVILRQALKVQAVPSAFETGKATA